MFCFDMAGACTLDSYQQIPALSGEPVYGLSTRGVRRLVALSGRACEGMEIYTYGDLCKSRFSLELESPEAPLLVGEVLLDDAPSRHVTLEMTPMLSHIRLRSVSADFSACPYAGSLFFNTSLFLGFAVSECLPLGSAGGPRPISWMNTGFPDSAAIRQLPFPGMLLQEGLGGVGPERLLTDRDFYCYPGPDTRLVLAGTVGKDTCFYAVPLPELRPGCTCELHLTLLRKGTPRPDTPARSGSVRAETVTLPWKREDPVTVEYPVL